MYAALWRRLPGPWPAKLVQVLVLLLAFVAFCFLWLFPTITPYLPFEDVTVEPEPTATLPPTPATTGATP